MANIQGRGPSGPLLVGSIYRNYLDSSLCKICRCSLIYLLVYLFKHFFIKVWTHGRILYSLGYNLIHVILLIGKVIQPVHPKGNQSWICIGRTDVEAETPIFGPPDVKSWLIWKDPDAWRERLKVGGEGDNRGWDGWMASLTQWTWVWVNSGSWWWIGRPVVLRFMGWQRVRHGWATDWWLTRFGHWKLFQLGSCVPLTCSIPLFFECFLTF